MIDEDQYVTPRELRRILAVVEGLNSLKQESCEFDVTITDENGDSLGSIGIEPVLVDDQDAERYVWRPRGAV